MDVLGGYETQLIHWTPHRVVDAELLIGYKLTVANWGWRPGRRRAHEKVLVRLIYLLESFSEDDAITKVNCLESNLILLLMNKERKL
jgi:hypothetical protein